MDSLETRSSKALADYHSGHFSDAIQAQVAILNEVLGDNERWVAEAKTLCRFFFGAGDYHSCIPILRRLLELEPENIDGLENLGLIYKRIGEHRSAIYFLQKAFENAPDRFNLNDALAHACSAIGDLDKAIWHGEKSLRLKDLEASKVGRKFEIEEPPKPFSSDYPGQNIISFSLWGNHPKYLKGAVQNAQLAPALYSGWTCRFYCDESVPVVFLEKLRALGAEVVLRPKPTSHDEGILWRIEVMSDASISRFLIRDADCVINNRERVAVDEWLRSDCHFHLMRDSFSHSELIHAGMWGGITGVLPSSDELLRNYSPTYGSTSKVERVFLRERVWPTVKQSVLIHDRHFRCFDSKPFPILGKLPGNRHVGQIESALWEKDGFPAAIEEEAVALTS